MNSTLEVIFGLLGGLAVFIFGMNMMSDCLQKAAGEKMKRILALLTKNPILGVLAGALTTAVLDPQHQHQQPPHRDQQAGQRRAHQILQQHAAQRGQSSLFHRYPTPHTVLSSFSGSGTPAARSFARIFLMCCVTAVSSAVPSMPKTAS